ncbi:MAG: amidohydrolase family protein [Bdellovibrionales bacterium]
MRFMALGLFLFHLSSHAADLLLKNAQVVDPHRREVFAGQVLVKDGVVHTVSRTEIRGHKGDILDVKGRYLVPAFADMHLHPFGHLSAGWEAQIFGAECALKVNLYAGVMTVLDLFSDPDEMFRLREKQQRGEIAGAQLHSSLGLLTCTGGHGTEYGPHVQPTIVDTPAQAVSAVKALVQKKPDVIKIVYDHARHMPSMDKATMSAAVATANEFGIKTVVHIGTWNDAREAVLAGATAITHVYEKEAVPENLVSAMHDHKAWSIPTLAVYSDFANFTDYPEILNSQLAKEIAKPEILASYQKFDVSHASPMAEYMLGFTRRGRGVIGPAVHRLSDAGVRVLTGTDAGNPGTITGYSVHREMKLLVEAGMDPWDALRASTTEAAAFLGGPGGFEKGALANFVILDRSPVKNIENTESIHAVIQHGRQIQRRELLRGCEG